MDFPKQSEVKLINQEEIEVKLGLNLATLKVGFEKAKALVESFVHDIGHSISHLAKEFSAPFALAGIVAGMEKAMQRAEQISRIAEASGLDSEVWQKLAFTVKGVGGSAEDAEKWISKLSATIGEARNGSDESAEKFSKWGIELHEVNGVSKSTESIIESIASKMEEMADPTMKAAMAVDIFGKGAAKAVAALSEWKKSHGAGADFFTNEDIESLKEANHEIESLENGLTVLEGEFLAFYKNKSAVADWATALGHYSVGGFSKFDNRQDVDDIENTVNTLRRLAEMRKQTKARMDESAAFEFAKAEKAREKEQEDNMIKMNVESEISKIRQDAAMKEVSLKSQEAALVERILKIKKEQSEIDSESLQYAEKEKVVSELTAEAQKVQREILESKNKIREAGIKLEKSNRNLHNSELDQFMPTLDEVRNSGHWENKRWGSGKNWVESPFAGTVREEDRLKNKIHNDILMGRGADPNDVKNFQDLQKQLNDAGIGSESAKLDEMRTSAKESAQELKDLNEKVNGKGGGVVITPGMFSGSSK